MFKKNKELNEISTEIYSFFKKIIISLIFSIVGFILTIILKKIPLNETELEIMLGKYVGSLIPFFRILFIAMPIIPIINLIGSSLVSKYNALSDKDKKTVQKFSRNIGYTIIGYWILDRLCFKK